MAGVIVCVTMFLASNTTTIIMITTMALSGVTMAREFTWLLR